MKTKQILRLLTFFCCSLLYQTSYGQTERIAIGSVTIDQQQLSVDDSLSIVVTTNYGDNSRILAAVYFSAPNGYVYRYAISYNNVQQAFVWKGKLPYFGVYRFSIELEQSMQIVASEELYCVEVVNL